jgi:hypothetical protein
MGRTPRCAAATKRTPYSRPKPRGRPPRSSQTIYRTPATSVDASLLNCESSPDGERLTFHLHNRTSYTISPAESSPEHFWGTIYSAEWFHPDSGQNWTCAIKASDFLLRQEDDNDSRAEYRRPRQDFDREVRTFQSTKHKNVLEMYGFWEWEAKGYIAMKKMKGSLGDVLYESAYQNIVKELRWEERVLAELVRQVPSRNLPLLTIDFNWSGPHSFTKYHLSRCQTRQSFNLVTSTYKIGGFWKCTFSP